MDTKHTPGPWFTTGTRGTRYVEARIGFGLQEVAACGPTEKAGQQEANARLIAAAPLLLDALRDCVALIERDMPGDRAAQPELIAARAAIAAATN